MPAVSEYKGMPHLGVSGSSIPNFQRPIGHTREQIALMKDLKNYLNELLQEKKAASRLDADTLAKSTADQTLKLGTT